MIIFSGSVGFWSFLGFGLVNCLSVAVYLLFSRQASKGLDINTPGLNE